MEQKLYDPAVVSDPKEYARLAKERSNQMPLVEKAREYVGALDDIDTARELMREESDSEARAMLQEEVEENQAKLPGLEEEIKILLIPGDPNDEKNTIIEIRGAAGGDEANIFAGDLYAMYRRLADRRGWKFEPIDASPSDAGGFKTVEFKLTGDKVYSVMKYEAGVHRVQRVPKTESQGRIQTSTATVAVMPEADEIDVQIDPSDLRIDTFCASGPGGQCVNTTYSAVRITHLPTNTVVQSQDQRSQIQNREQAMRVLRARLYEMQRRQAQDEYDSARRAQVGTGDRSERIRTYNFPQGRVTDHRIGLTLYKIDEIMQGNLDEIIDALTLAEQTVLLEEQNRG